MSRQASPATQIRNLTSLLRKAQEDVRSLRAQRDHYQAQLVARVREVEEWKKRFDALLKVVPEHDGDSRSE